MVECGKCISIPDLKLLITIYETLAASSVFIF